MADDQMRILLVEDEQTIAVTLTDDLEGAGYEVKHVGDNSVGLETGQFRRAGVFWCRLAVLAVIVPLSPRRCVSLHQQTRFPPDLPIEPLNSKFLAALRPVGALLG